jgi:phospholipid/cholesterol/gamma-HCH transport system ATP-binding protein
VSPDAIAFRGVSKSFGGRPALDGLDARIPSEGVTFVVGQSGSGKSVLCRLAVGLLAPDQGEVTLLGEPIARLPERRRVALRRRAPYLVQAPGLLDWLSSEDNVALAAGGDLARARRSLERVGESAHARSFPTALGPGTNKRVSLARAIALDPEFLLLDEPTTGLTRDAADEVISAIARLAGEGVGALVVSHDFRAMERLADRVLWIRDGRAGFLGTAEDFLSSVEPGLEAFRAPGMVEASFDG